MLYTSLDFGIFLSIFIMLNLEYLSSWYSFSNFPCSWFDLHLIIFKLHIDVVWLYKNIDWTLFWMMFWLRKFQKFCHLGDPQWTFSIKKSCEFDRFLMLNCLLAMCLYVLHYWNWKLTSGAFVIVRLVRLCALTMSINLCTNNDTASCDCVLVYL